MSDLFGNLDWIPAGVLVASLLGSGHCVAMCGGLVTSFARDRAGMVRYHLSRLAGYMVLGGVAGFLGQSVLGSPILSRMGLALTLIWATLLLVLGVRLWRGLPVHLFHLPAGLWRRFPSAGAATAGILSAFLPCGWLHLFLLGAVATQSFTRGALYLAVFWLGTVPALSFAPWAVSRVLAPWRARRPKLAGALIIALALSSLGLKIAPSFSRGNSHCHANSPGPDAISSHKH